MYTKTLKELTNIKDQIMEIIDNHGEILIESTKSEYLQDELRRNILDVLLQINEDIELISENIDSGEYGDYVDDY